MTKIQIIQTMSGADIAKVIFFLSLGNLIFEFVSNFEIRISGFADEAMQIHALWTRIKGGPSDPGFLL